MHRVILSTVAAMTMVVAASAQTLYIPAAANAEGANQTNWRTDLQVKAQGGEPAAFTIELLESRVNNNDPVALDFDLEANESLRLGNVLETEFAYNGTAALRITATEGRITATSRTYNDDPAGTYGQTVPAVEAGDAIDTGEQATLIQLSRSPDPSAGFRSNIGMVNLNQASTSIEISLFNADGSSIGGITKTLKPFEYRQFNDVFTMAGATDVADGYAVVESTTESASLIAYASVVDNGSGDAVFILGSADVLPAPTADRLVVFESFMRFG